jgi:KDO2-lipid IV(A) lauroyltransferase
MMIKGLLHFFESLRFLPLCLLRLLGAGLGRLLWRVAGRRRRIVRTNLRLCFPHLDSIVRDQLGKKQFVFVVQALLDRSWLWHASESTVKTRIRVTGDAASLAMLTSNDPSQQSQPIVMFAPHFVGLDAGWTALGLEGSREFTTIFTQQSSKQMDDWVYAGRMRFGRVRLFRKVQGVAEIVRSLKSGAALYLLPDMDFGAQDTVFVPFYGQRAATVTSLSRFARISGAKVLSVVTQLVPGGYEVKVGPVWEGFPTQDLQADTERMNAELEALIEPMPEQYYWVHMRFKTRPPGEASLY